MVSVKSIGDIEWIIKKVCVSCVCCMCERKGGGGGELSLI